MGAVGCFSVGAGSLLRAPALESKLSGQLGMGCAGDGSSSTVSALAISEEGGHAGIAGSVGGSGGQMSVSSGGAGADSDAGGHVDLKASVALDLGGSVNVTTSTGGSVIGCVIGGSVAGGGAVVSRFVTGGSVSTGSAASGSAASDSTASGSATSGSATLASTGCASSIGSPGSVGTVCAHSGVAFLSTSPLAGVSVFDQSGSPFCMGSAGRASSSTRSWVSAVFSGGATGTVCAQTGVVSRVGTAAAGSDEAGGGGAEPFRTTESWGESLDESFESGGLVAKSKSV